MRPLSRHLISNLKLNEKATHEKRNLILSILKSTTTKREARDYLNKYQNQYDSSESSSNWSSLNNGEEDASLESMKTQKELFVNRFLRGNNPFVNIYDDEKKISKIPLRVAIFQMKVSTIDNSLWAGIGETFKRLVQLGISPIISLDYDETTLCSFKQKELKAITEANRISNLLEKGEDGLKSTIVRSLFEINKYSIGIGCLEKLLIPLYQGIIPIIQPIGYEVENSVQNFLDSRTILRTLSASLLNAVSLLTLEKLVIIDLIGGIPSIERNQSSHVFINLSQEYSEIVSELHIGFLKPEERDMHLNNLETMNEILIKAHEITGNDGLTGIITTPYIMSINNDQLNPIIYNVLTDRPVISSSLPSSQSRTPELSTSVVKRGMEVRCFDSDFYDGEFSLSMLIQKKEIDPKKLFALIEDSFGKKLYFDEYYRRIDKTLATLVIVGDYDGAAIITWESNEKANSKVAYLDKFAIAKRNQGLSGLADVIFKLILQSHPHELFWRSRKNNPINKWYFERCTGTMSVPGSRWKIFFTGDIFDRKIKKIGRKAPSSTAIDIQSKVIEYVNVGEEIPPSFK